MIILTQAERIKFAEWLEQETESDKLLVEQLKLISSPILFVRKEEIKSQQVIDKKLRGIESL